MKKFLKFLKNNPIVYLLIGIVAFMIFAIAKFYLTGKYPFE